eukprot:1195750-Prorocentrum_minimum.AAC.10
MSGNSPTMWTDIAMAAAPAATAATAATATAAAGESISARELRSEDGAARVPAAQAASVPAGGLAGKSLGHYR